MTAALKPVCAHCLDPVGHVWQIMTGTRTYLICGSRGCEQWAWSQGLSAWPQRPAPPRRINVCAGCGGDLPRRTGDRFGTHTRPYCTLTCAQSEGPYPNHG